MRETKTKVQANTGNLLLIRNKRTLCTEFSSSFSRGSLIGNLCFVLVLRAVLLAQEAGEAGVRAVGGLAARDDGRLVLHDL